MNMRNRTGRKKGIGVLLLFELLYKAMFLMILYLLFYGAFRLVLRIMGYSYLTMENMFEFLKNPITLFVLFGLIIVCTLFYLIETVSLIIFYQGYVKAYKISVVKILFTGIRETLCLLKRMGRAAVLLFSFVNAAVTLAPMIATFAARFRVPAYIAKVVVEQVTGLGIVVFFVALCLFINFFGIYSLYYCVLGETTFLEGFRKSTKLLKRNLGRFFVRMFGANLVLWLCYLIVYAIVLIVSCYIIYRTKPERVLVAAMLTIHDEVALYMGVLVTIMGQIVNYAVLSAFFYQYGPRLLRINQVEKLQEQIVYEDAIRRMEAAGVDRHLGLQSWYTKVTLLVAVFVAGFHIYSIYNALRNGSLADKETLFGTYITAHRGASAEAPENTLEALRLAIECMADYAEIDVQLTKDGVVILMHDPSLWRTTGQRLTVSGVDYGLISELDAGSWFHKDYAGTRIPTLKQAIELCKGKINLNIELKAEKSGKRNRELVEKVVSMIWEYNLEAQCVLSSTSHEMLEMVKELAREIKTGYILAFAYGNFYNLDCVDFYSIRYNFVNENIVRKLHSLGKEVHVWTVDTRSGLERMKQLGVDNIITDNAVLAREVVYGDRVRKGFFKLLGLVRQ